MIFNAAQIIIALFNLINAFRLAASGTSLEPYLYLGLAILLMIGVVFQKGRPQF